MRGPASLARALTYAVLAAAPLLGAAEDLVLPAKRLPQAKPGSPYAAQLAIPPTLGYPFASCSLRQETASAPPRWLTIDCDRLLLRGRVPVAPAAQEEHNLVLTISDHLHNSVSVELMLRVSAKPEVVDLVDNGTGPAARPIDHAVAKAADHPVDNAAGKPREPLPALQAEHAKSSAESDGKGKPGDSAQPGNRTVCFAPPGETGEAVAPERKTLGLLSAANQACLGTANKSTCAAALAPLKKSASATEVALKECSLDGFEPAPAGTGEPTAPLSAPVKGWYAGRAAQWQKLAAGLDSHAKAVTEGSYAVPASLSKGLTNFANGEAPAASASSPPEFIGILNAGATVINVSASNGAQLSLYSIQLKTDDKATQGPPQSCDKLPIDVWTLIPLKATETDSSIVTQVTTDFSNSSSGVQALYLQQPLLVGTNLCVVQKMEDTAGPPPDDRMRYSRVAVVEDTLNWGRVRAYFVGGVLISNTESNFSSSSANQFLDVNVDKFWKLPGCATMIGSQGDCSTPRRKLIPGLSTYFDTRLTAIPIAVKPALDGTTGNSAQATQTAVSESSSLTSQKTARVQVGGYAPFIINTWTYNRTPNAIYLAPIAKVGFDTLTGSTNLTVDKSEQTTQAQLQRVYSFYSFGGRIGHFGLYSTRSKSPELLSYLDINFGPYSNLESYVCKANASWAKAATSASDCGAPGTPLANLPYASLKRIWRLDLEGLMKIPSTPLVIGFNANIGQKALGSQNLDTRRVPNDDVRFLFGTKFDIASVMKRLGVGQ